MTISAGAVDIDKKILSKLEGFMKEECEAGIFALERGGTCAHLHVQGLIRAAAKNACSMNARLNKLLGWDDCKPSPGARVMCKSLSGKKLHTWHGLIGYCMKDSVEKHFECVTLNISDDDISLGFDQYLMHGIGPLKDRTSITPGNIFDRAIIFYNQHERGRPRVQLPQVLTHMITSTKFYPSSQWVIPHQGQGMDMDRANKVWRMMVHPKETKVEDVFLVFARRHAVPGVQERYFVTPVPEEQPLVQVDLTPNRNRENLDGEVVFIDPPEEDELEPVVVANAPSTRLFKIKTTLR